MSRLPTRPLTAKPAVSSGDLRKSVTQLIFSADLFSPAESVSRSCPDVLFDVPISANREKKGVFIM